MAKKQIAVPSQEPAAPMPLVPRPRAWPAAETASLPLDSLVPYDRNARTHSPQQIGQIMESIRRFGWTMPILIDEDRRIIAGHGRVMAARSLGILEAPCIIARGWSEDEKRAYVLADNKLSLNAGWDEDLLLAELSALSPEMRGLAGFTEEEFAELLDPFGQSGRGATPGNLADRFGVPPFSVLRAAEGWWQSRKSGWLALGIESEVGRGENLLKFSETVLEPDPKKRRAKPAAQPGGPGGTKGHPKEWHAKHKKSKPAKETTI